MVDRGKRSRILNKVKTVEIINMNPESFLELSPVQKKVPPSHKLLDHANK